MYRTTATLQYGRTALMMAVESGEIGMVQALLNAGADATLLDAVR
jgi:ankyrin repeat protein